MVGCDEGLEGEPSLPTFILSSDEHSLPSDGTLSACISSTELALYVYEYLLHVGAQKSAQTFLSEADLGGPATIRALIARGERTPIADSTRVRGHKGKRGVAVEDVGSGTQQPGKERKDKSPCRRPSRPWIEAHDLGTHLAPVPGVVAPQRQQYQSRREIPRGACLGRIAGKPRFLRLDLSFTLARGTLDRCGLGMTPEPSDIGTIIAAKAYLVMGRKELWNLGKVRNFPAPSGEVEDVVHGDLEGLIASYVVPCGQGIGYRPARIRIPHSATLYGSDCDRLRGNKDRRHTTKVQHRDRPGQEWHLGRKDGMEGLRRKWKEEGPAHGNGRKGRNGSRGLEAYSCSKKPEGGRGERHVMGRIGGRTRKDEGQEGGTGDEKGKGGMI
ncbi:unnamed protein product [Arctogadus glacialis]